MKEQDIEFAIEMIQAQQDLTLTVLRHLKPSPEIEAALETIIAKQREIDSLIDKIIEAENQD